MTTTTPAFGRGGDSAQEAEDALSASRGGFARTHYLPIIGKDKSMVLRYITDEQDWIHAMTHGGAQTKNKPSDWPEARKWPEQMPATCRHDKAFVNMYGDCYICDNNVMGGFGKASKPTLRISAIACLREEVLWTAELVAQRGADPVLIGKRAGYRDATREIAETDEKGEPTGKTRIEPALVLVQKAMSNYFGGLKAMAKNYGTICDRDFIVQQRNENKDIEFHHIPLDKDGLAPGTEGWKRYEDALVAQKLDIQAILADKASDDYFARFFDPTKIPAPRQGKDDSTAGSQDSAQQSAPTNEPDPDRLAAMRARVQSAGGSPAPTTSVDSTPAGASARTSTMIDFSAG